MIRGGNATVFVSDMNRAVRFYTETLGLKLRCRYGNEWAEVDAGDGMVLGLHPEPKDGPKPGTSGSIEVGLTATEPIEKVVATLQARGVKFRGPIRGNPEEGVKLAFFGDPDDNHLYLCQTMHG